MISRVNTYNGQNGTVVKANTVYCCKSNTRKSTTEDRRLPTKIIQRRRENSMYICSVLPGSSRVYVLSTPTNPSRHLESTTAKALQEGKSVLEALKREGIKAAL